MENGSIAKRLRSARRKQRLSARELSIKAGLAGGTVNHIERGVSRNPKTNTLVNIAAALEVSLDWLMTGHPEA